MKECKVELFCVKDFHAYVGVDVCLLFCRKKICSVFQALQKEGKEVGGVRVGGWVGEVGGKPTVR